MGQSTSLEVHSLNVQLESYRAEITAKTEQLAAANLKIIDTCDGQDRMRERHVELHEKLKLCHAKERLLLRMTAGLHKLSHQQHRQNVSETIHSQIASARESDRAQIDKLLKEQVELKAAVKELEAQVKELTRSLEANKDAHEKELATQAHTKASVQLQVSHLEEANRNLMTALSNIHRQFSGVFGTFAKPEQYVHACDMHDPYHPLKHIEYRADVQAQAGAAAPANADGSTSEPETEMRPEADISASCKVELGSEFSIEKRLEKRGAGKSEQVGSFAASLAWNNSEQRNDLDLWVTPPDGERIYYGHKTSPCGGALDVDSRQDADDPVENIVWKANAPRGDYKIEVCNYQPDHDKPVPCEVRIVKDGGHPQKFNVTVPGQPGATVHVTTVTLSRD